MGGSTGTRGVPGRSRSRPRGVRRKCRVVNPSRGAFPSRDSAGQRGFTGHDRSVPARKLRRPQLPRPRRRARRRRHPQPRASRRDVQHRADPVAAIVAAIKAGGQDSTGWQFGAVKTFAFTLKFQSGVMVFFSSEDGAPSKVGWQGTYALPDDHTIVATHRDHTRTGVGRGRTRSVVRHGDRRASSWHHPSGSTPLMRQATAAVLSPSPAPFASSVRGTVPHGTNHCRRSGTQAVEPVHHRGAVRMATRPSYDAVISRWTARCSN